MGATSVTGTGLGSVEGKNMGSKHYTVGASRILGPRIVAAGKVALTAGSAVVVLPKLGGDSTDYSVQVTDNSSSAAAASASLAFNAEDVAVTIKGTGTNTVSWAILHNGLAY